MNQAVEQIKAFFNSKDLKYYFNEDKDGEQTFFFNLRFSGRTDFSISTILYPERDALLLMGEVDMEFDGADTIEILRLVNDYNLRSLRVSACFNKERNLVFCYCIETPGELLDINVYEKSFDLVRRVTVEETAQIAKDIFMKTHNKSKGIFSFLKK